MSRRSRFFGRRRAVRGRPRPHHILAPAALAGLLAGSDVAPVEAAPDQEAHATASAHDRWASLEREADHPDPERRVRLASQLPSELAALSDVERARQVASWSTAPSPRVRLAIARALRYSPRAPGTLTAIEHLAADRSPSVRVAIAEAAWLRRREHPRRLIHVLHRLADDDHVFVREVARLALGDA